MTPSSHATFGALWMFNGFAFSLGYGAIGCLISSSRYLLSSLPAKSNDMNARRPQRLRNGQICIGGPEVVAAPSGQLCFIVCGILHLRGVE
ncbi:hypothetical protein K458DRAFT_99716 [Lentithecium fluviatile CBS 122367]|uniref:Uncharacterized protein n=1 Tax=Lentithecium fluviatile CBS 122367 TaxID=1168545 RepID=A0A6G1JJ57_9PLEO|nr:hypothetical protein K458DRAFT_99716 [Lentithecium fluviatile CBS 122367]